jgi:hypothetical protein
MRCHFIGREALHHPPKQVPDIGSVGLAANGSEAVESISRRHPMFHGKYIVVLHNGNTNPHPQ